MRKWENPHITHKPRKHFIPSYKISYYPNLLHKSMFDWSTCVKFQAPCPQGLITQVASFPSKQKMVSEYLFLMTKTLLGCPIS
jgi:hypothetical protein